MTEKSGPIDIRIKRSMRIIATSIMKLFPLIHRAFRRS